MAESRCWEVCNDICFQCHSFFALLDNFVFTDVVVSSIPVGLIETCGDFEPLRKYFQGVLNSPTRDFHIMDWMSAVPLAHAYLPNLAIWGDKFATVRWLTTTFWKDDCIM